jgi:hypothetical protein
LSPDQERTLLDRLAAIHAALKTFDSVTEWVEERGRSIVLHYRAPLKIAGVLGGGVIAHFKTPLQVWESDVYGQIEVHAGGQKSALRLDPLEWRQPRPHRNPAAAPSDLRLLEIEDRIHPFGLNRRLGIGVYLQRVTGIAIPFPRAIDTFEAYLDLCAEVWNCPDARDIPPPTWSKSLI